MGSFGRPSCAPMGAGVFHRAFTCSARCHPACVRLLRAYRQTEARESPRRPVELFAFGHGPTKPLTLLVAFACVTGSKTDTIMANTKSAIKAARQAKRRTERNRGVKTRLKTLRKTLDALLAAKDPKAQAAAADYASAMDKATKSGVVHRNAASRAKAHASKAFALK
jgi:small subunit ribosomal protein S20